MEADERETLLDLLDAEPELLATRPRQTLIGDKLVARTPEGDEGAGGARSDALRLTGAPIETISLAVELDATDQLADGDPEAVLLGIHPQLAALEMLLYPKSSVVLENMALTAVGTIELVPMEAPLTLLVWGAGRVLPMRLTSFSITEQAYDTQLRGHLIWRVCGSR